MRLKHYLDQGVSKAELSRRFGVSERTIHYWIAKGQLDRDLAAGGARYASRPTARHRCGGVNRLRGSALEVCNFQLSKPCNFRLTLTARPAAAPSRASCPRPAMERLASRPRTCHFDRARASKCYLQQLDQLNELSCHAQLHYCCGELAVPPRANLINVFLRPSASKHGAD